MSWLDAVPVALLAAVWLFVPGLLVTYGLGLRSFAAWGLAPVVTVAIVATLAVLAQKVGIGWSVGLVLVVALVVAVLVAAVCFLLRRRWPALPADPPKVTLAAVVGLVPAVILGVLTFARGIGSPDALSQTYDAVLHYNAIASILDTHDASSLTIGNLDIPGDPGSFYPAAWHDLTSLIVLSGGASIPLAVNMVSGVIGIVVWPVSCLLLVRQVIGRSATGMAITGLVSVAFTAFPWDLLGFGVLWPNLLGNALTPAILALVVSVVGQARDDVIGRSRAWVMLPVALLAAGFAHPNSIFTVIALSLVPVFVAVGTRAWRLHREGRTWRGVAECVVAVVVFGAFWYWSATTPAFAAVRDFFWPPIATPARAVGDVLFQSTNGYSALWLLALVTIGGILLARRDAALRWVAGGFVITGFLYVIAASFNKPSTEKFTGFWYNDPHRLSAMLPMTAVPLAVATLLWLGRKLAEFAVHRPNLPQRLRTRAFAGSTLVVLVLLGLLTGGLYVGKHTQVVAALYQTKDPSLEIVDPAEQAFFARVKRIVPPDAMVASNPWDGSALLWALADRRVLFPHLQIAMTPNLVYLAANYNLGSTDPTVCRIAGRLKADYLLVGDHTFWPWDARTGNYPGMADPAPGSGFQLVASSGDDLKLFQLTGCNPKS